MPEVEATAVLPTANFCAFLDDTFVFVFLVEKFHIFFCGIKSTANLIHVLSPWL